MKNSSFSINPPYKNKSLGFGISLLTVLSVFNSADLANAASFSFSFTNEDGLVDGVVEGTLELPDGNGSFNATALSITSAPTDLGYSLPLNILDSSASIINNIFVVTDGMITSGSFIASSFESSFRISAGTAFGSALGVNGNSSFTTGVWDTDGSTLVFSTIDPPTDPVDPPTDPVDPPVTKVPEPSTLSFLALSVLTTTILKRKQKTK